MAFEWAPGVGFAIAGSFLAWYKSNTQTEERVSTLRKDFEKHAAENEELKKAVFEELREAYERFRNTMEEMKVMAASQAGVNAMCAKTLDAIAKKLEFHDSAIMTQNTEIQVLKTKVSGGGGE